MGGRGGKKVRVKSKQPKGKQQRGKKQKQAVARKQDKNRPPRADGPLLGRPCPRVSRCGRYTIVCLSA